MQKQTLYIDVNAINDKYGVIFILLAQITISQKLYPPLLLMLSKNSNNTISIRIYIEPISATEKDSHYSQAKKVIEYYKMLFKTVDKISNHFPEEKVIKKSNASLLTIW